MNNIHFVEEQIAWIESIESQENGSCSGGRCIYMAVIIMVNISSIYLYCIYIIIFIWHLTKKVQKQIEK